MDSLLEESSEYVFEEEFSGNSIDQEISQDEVWVIIDDYFRKKGLVGQQLDSFDEFIKTTIQDLIEDTGEVSVIPENQYNAGQDVEQVICSSEKLSYVFCLYNLLTFIFNVVVCIHY